MDRSIRAGRVAAEASLIVVDAPALLRVSRYERR
jgi:hypothetical protein